MSRRHYLGRALARPVSEIVAAAAGALALAVLLALYFWATACGLPYIGD